MSNRTVRNTEHCPMPLKAAVLALALSAAMTPSRSQAADLTVDAGGACTLTEAITSANDDNAAGNGCADGSGADTITLEKDVTLTAALPDITTEITIEGAGYMIDGNNGDFSVLNITDGNLTLNETTVTGGNSNGISSFSDEYYSSSVTVNNSTISGNTGSGISSSSYSFYSDSSVTVNNSTISGNTGGGIVSSSDFFCDSSVTVNNSTISGNTGIGISSSSFSSHSSVTVNNSTISGNTGSGISSSSDSANFDFLSDSSVTVNNSTISSNTGSGISSSSYSFYSNVYSSVTVNNSAISGNTGSSANEIYSTGPNSSVIAAAGNIFGHSGETNAQAFSGFTPVHDSDFVATSNGGGTPTPLASILSPLADNGGPTKTHALPPGSPAIDLDPTCITGLTEDQRGYTRPVGTGCDAGSFEFCADNPCGCGRDMPANTWLMTAPSCTPVPTGINNQYGTDLGGTYGTDWISFEWLTGTQAYNQQDGAADLTLGKGNWNYSHNTGTLTLNGTATPTEDCSAYGWTGQTCHPIDLTPSSGSDIWQLVGHPFPYTVDWADVRIAVNSGSGWMVYKPGDAQTAGYVNNAYHTWNGSSYQTYDDSTPGKLGILLPQEAIWLRILSGSNGLSAGNFKLLIPAR